MNSFIVLLFLLVFHVLAMALFEGLSLGNAVWLTMTSATTVGYGDLAPKTSIGRWATILLLYIGGIAMLARVGSLCFELNLEKKMLIAKGLWNWKMKNHIVFINCGMDLDERYFYRLLLDLRKSRSPVSRVPVLIVSEHFSNGVPESLDRIDVKLLKRNIMDPDLFTAAGLLDARYIVVMCPEVRGPHPDSLSFELIGRMRFTGIKAVIVAEIALHENRKYFLQMGADHVLRPNRGYPEMLSRVLVAPGVESIMETLFDSDSEECVRYDVSVSGVWSEIVSAFVTADLGVPIGYESLTGGVISSPQGTGAVSAKGIFVFAGKENLSDSKTVQVRLDKLFPGP